MPTQNRQRTSDLRPKFVPASLVHSALEASIARGLRLLRLGLAAAVLVAALLSFSAWILGDTLHGARRLADWDGDGVAMQPNTCLGIALVAVALLLHSLHHRRIAGAVALLALLLGVVVMLENLLGWNSGLDTLVITPTWGQTGTAALGRMGLPASASIALLGLVMLAAMHRDCERHPVCSRLIAMGAVLVLAITTLGLVGWSLGAVQLHLIPRLTAIATQTSVLLLGLALAALTLSPRVEPLLTLLTPTAAGAMLRRTLPALVLIVLALSWLRTRGEVAGLYESAFGTALRTVLEIFLLGGLVWWMARAVGRHEQVASRQKDELLEQSVRMAAIVESTDDAIVSKDLSGVIRTWNRSAERIFGYSAGEIVGKHISTIIPRDRHAEEDMVIAKLRAGEAIDHFQTRRIAKDGRLIDVSLSISPLRGPTGEIIGACKVARDITERVRHERALREAREREDLALRAASVGTWEWNLRTGEMRWDDMLFAMYGVTPTPAGLVTPETWAERVLPEDFARTRQLLDENIHKGARHTREFRIRHGRTGEIRTFEAIEIVRMGEDGEPEWVAGTNLDITERVRHAALLREAREREHLALEASGVGLWQWNLRTDEVRWDEVMFRLYGVEPTPGGVVTYRTWADLVHPDDLPEQSRVLQRIVAAGGTQRREFRIRHAVTGEIRIMEAVDSVRYDEHGQPEWVAGTNLDITDRRTIEQELAMHRQNLENLVVERTRQLEQAQAGLRRAERMATIGTLAAGLGHDLRNIMLPVKVRLQSLNKAELPSAAKEDVQDISESIQYLERLASGLMQLAANPDASTTSAGATGGTDLRAWWGEAKGVIRSVLPRCVKLVVQMPWDEHAAQAGTAETVELPPVAVHRVALTQAVFNLVQNAGELLGARGSGTVTIAICLVDCGGDNGRVEREVQLSIADDGPGMSEDVASKCFEPYFSTKGRTVSTGMGLSLVRGVIEAAGGSVELRTVPGQGATFVLRLPTIRSLENRVCDPTNPQTVVEVLPRMSEERRKPVDR